MELVLLMLYLSAFLVLNFSLRFFLSSHLEICHRVARGQAARLDEVLLTNNTRRHRTVSNPHLQESTSVGPRRNDLTEASHITKIVGNHRYFVAVREPAALFVAHVVFIGFFAVGL